MQDDLPEYYLGMIYYYDADGDDNCRWCVYDHGSIVRCFTRRDALNYIQQAVTDIGTSYLTELRLALVYARQLENSIRQVTSLSPMRLLTRITKTNAAYTGIVTELQQLFDDALSAQGNKLSKTETKWPLDATSRLPTGNKLPKTETK